MRGARVDRPRKRRAHGWGQGGQQVSLAQETGEGRGGRGGQGGRGGRGAHATPILYYLTAEGAGGRGGAGVAACLVGVDGLALLDTRRGVLRRGRAQG